MVLVNLCLHRCTFLALLPTIHSQPGALHERNCPNLSIHLIHYYITIHRISYNKKPSPSIHPSIHTLTHTHTVIYIPLQTFNSILSTYTLSPSTSPSYSSPIHIHIPYYLYPSAFPPTLLPHVRVPFHVRSASLFRIRISHPSPTLSRPFRILYHIHTYIHTYPTYYPLLSLLYFMYCMLPLLYPNYPYYTLPYPNYPTHTLPYPYPTLLYCMYPTLHTCSVHTCPAHLPTYPTLHTYPVPTCPHPIPSPSPSHPIP